ncbi:MAG: conjugative transposon protein TraJ [Candidatus Pedobacter colombiensis]|uniref:Conjugative transposon protein TraJ n=1 Tax=Candidatus Pedobacter colombiensis TaxID=3121371 RepID=A0AAJ5W5Y1_9SPHI|nr:conjugative transposon protein TraJ [Pedobacter sp.]WEK17861.1 MAG: conjugative transposon protein TraJ [Pedobacter sp.]
MKVKNKVSICFFAIALLLTPFTSMAQGLSEQVSGLQAVLDKVYNEMIPLCSDLISVARGIAGFGALWYIASRVWGNIARAEPIDFYPLLRPFALGMAILSFPMVLGVMNGVLSPTVTGTSAMVKDSDATIKALLKRKELELKKTDKWKYLVGDDGMGDRKEWYKYTHPEDKNGTDENWVEAIGNNMRFWLDKQDYKMRHSFKQFMSEVLQVVYYAASLCINTVRTFFLIVLAILGPLVLGFAVFDGLQHTLSVWIARYINIYLWLPIANIFGAILGKIQQSMIKLDIEQAQQNGDTFFSSTDLAYLLFLIIGIIGYRCVPNVANYIIHAGGGNSMLTRVNSMTGTTSRTSQNIASQTAKAAGGIVSDVYDNAYRNIGSGMAEASGQDYFKDKLSGK